MSETALDRLKRFAAQLVTSATTEGLESRPGQQDATETLLAPLDLTDQERDAARRALSLEIVTPQDQHVLEAIVLPKHRPAIDVVAGTFRKPPSPWEHFDSQPIRGRLESAIRSVGRVEVPGHPSVPYGGTGFVVAPNLVMTNRHVAELFTQGLGRNVSFRPDQRSELDFRAERGSSAQERSKVVRVVMIHPLWDMALLELEPSDRPHLELDPVADLTGREIAVLGYPAYSPYNDATLQNEIFDGVYQVKRLQPGLVRSSRAIRDSYQHDVTVLDHDASTLGGNSGSAVIDVATGRVVGLHFSGAYLVGNYAVPARELARDGRVIDAGVRFVGGDRRESPSPADPFWRQTEQAAPSVSQAQAQLQSPVQRIVVPIEITVTLGQPSGASVSIATVTAATTPVAPSELGSEVETALREAAKKPYYAKKDDLADRDAYYAKIDFDAKPRKLADQLSSLLRKSHTEAPRYDQSRRLYLYPWVDLHPDRKLRSIYSAARQSFEPETILREDVQIERVRIEKVQRESLSPVELEAAAPYNCEHVVPQSWFGADEPMRGDLHHLFTCEGKCNSFRNNRSYWEFGEEGFKADCGTNDAEHFQPSWGHGAVARATLYFLLRYAGRIELDERLTSDQLAMLLRWHDGDPVAKWERHRNQAIFEIQGNRNPLIDFPERAEDIGFPL